MDITGKKAAERVAVSIDRFTSDYTEVLLGMDREIKSFNHRIRQLDDQTRELREASVAVREYFDSHGGQQGVIKGAARLVLAERLGEIDNSLRGLKEAFHDSAQHLEGVAQVAAEASQQIGRNVDIGSIADQIERGTNSSIDLAVKRVDSMLGSMSSSLSSQLISRSDQTEREIVQIGASQERRFNALRSVVQSFGESVPNAVAETAKGEGQKTRSEIATLIAEAESARANDFAAVEKRLLMIVALAACAVLVPIVLYVLG